MRFLRGHARRGTRQSPEERQAKTRVWRENNREHVKQYKRADREANPEKHREARRRYREANRAAVLAGLQQWRAANVERRREYQQDWYALNRETELPKRREWNRLNPEKRAVTQRRRQWRLRAAGGDVDPSWIGVLNVDPCSYCGARAGTVDHITPLHAEGANDWANLTAACGSCNSSKSTKSLLAFMQDTPAGSRRIPVTL